MHLLKNIPHITGVEINYYLVCKKKLWFFTRQITMEQNSERVEIGKIIHEDSYNRKKKELLIDGIIMIDFGGKELTIHETKSTKAIDKASRMQLLYYIYYLEKKGIKGVKGIIHYYKNKTTEKVLLTDDDRVNIDNILKKIEDVKSTTVAPYAEKTKVCNKCSYYELCYC